MPSIRIGLALQPLSDHNLKLAAQIGADEVVFYDMTTMPMTTSALRDLRHRIQDRGMDMTVIEGGPPQELTVLGKPGRDAEIECYKRAVDAMGKAGFSVLCYDWMPAHVEVIRTSCSVRERGGALTTGFSAAAWEASGVQDAPEAPVHDDAMWRNLEYFLTRVIPTAESAGVRLALHPDDPPRSPICGIARIVRSPEHIERVLNMIPSRANALTFCQGCFSEMGVDMPAEIARFAPHAAFIHFRDTRGTSSDFHETFPDNGKTNMAAAMRAWLQAGYDGVIRPDHVPLLEGETHNGESGYSILGRLFAVGYMRGLLHALTP